jgi:hypothetical protein
MTEVKLHLGVPMVCRSGIAIVLQNLKTKKIKLEKFVLE